MEAEKLRERRTAVVPAVELVPIAVVVILVGKIGRGDVVGVRVCACRVRCPARSKDLGTNRGKKVAKKYSTKNTTTAVHAAKYEKIIEPIFFFSPLDVRTYATHDPKDTFLQMARPTGS